MGDDLSFELLDGGEPPPEPLPDQPRSSRLLLTALAGFVLLGVAALTGVLIAPGPPTPAPTIVVPAGLAEARIRASGFGGAVGGSLATDHEAVDQVRRRVLEVFGDTGGLVVTPAEVILLWAGDLGGQRWAVTLVPHQGGPATFVVLSGPAGTPVGDLTLRWHPETLWKGKDGLPVQPLAVFLSPVAASPSFSAPVVVNPATGETQPGVVFVIAPHVAGVEIATGRRLFPDGHQVTGWRPLRRQGAAVWADTISAGEQYLATYRVPGGPPTTGDVDGGPDVRAAAQLQATGRAAGTTDGRPAAACSADAARQSGASLAEQPALISVTPWGTDHILAVTLLHSPEGGWRWGICDTRTVRSGGSVQSSEAWTGSGVARSPSTQSGDVMAGDVMAGDLMAAVASRPGSYVVLAPAGADRVRVRGGAEAAVRDRLARVNGPRGGAVTFEALAGSGRVIGRFTLGATDG